MLEKIERLKMMISLCMLSKGCSVKLLMCLLKIVSLCASYNSNQGKIYPSSQKTIQTNQNQETKKEVPTYYSHFASREEFKDKSEEAIME